MAVLAGCERAPLPLECEQIPSGAIAVTEVRGPQSGADTWGQWIEIANTTQESLGLAGLVLEIYKLDGSGRHQMVVRDHDARLDPGEYYVLGRFPPDSPPPHVDWGFEDDFSGDIYTDAVLEVRSCQQLLDRVVWRNLPSEGSLSYDGRLQPDAALNDDDANWCNDRTPSESDGGTQAGLPGTPKEANHPCE
ncbi:MAG: hypothetical protein D6806_07080 [Deltaproteobacteria bacterium]|nr:MAG: hypothetical protein D6806_07080 [Deltaproteobacteria bacterium]